MGTPDYTPLPTIATGDVPGASWWNYTAANFERLIQPPMCVLRRVATPQIAADDSNVMVQFVEPDVIDTDGFHSTGSNPTRVTIPAGFGGVYRWDGTVQWEADNDGHRTCGVRINGTDLWLGAQVPAVQGGYTMLPFSATTILIEGDYLEVFTYHNAGASRDLQDVRFALTWLGRS